ncbi:hypothetical protein KIPB_012728, partial [Kipferlia bialata]|eukprot:g12728.t1
MVPEPSGLFACIPEADKIPQSLAEKAWRASDRHKSAVDSTQVDYAAVGQFLKSALFGYIACGFRAIAYVDSESEWTFLRDTLLQVTPPSLWSSFVPPFFSKTYESYVLEPMPHCALQ